MFLLMGILLTAENKTNVVLLFAGTCHWRYSELLALWRLGLGTELLRGGGSGGNLAVARQHILTRCDFIPRKLKKPKDFAIFNRG